MKKITITAKIQISVNQKDEILLKNTMRTYANACNYVSEYIYRTHDIRQFSLNKALYLILRERFNLRSQMAQSVIKTVVSKYKIIEARNQWTKPIFKKPQYDLVWNRDYSLTKNFFSVNTLNGRIKLPYFIKGMEKFFDFTKYKFGTAKLICKHGKYFLHIPVTYEVEENDISDISNIVGIDRGINFIIATYDSNNFSNFVSGKAIRQKRINYLNLRKELQIRNTPSAKRRLKAIGQRENRWIQDVNHCVSKALVEGNPKHTLFVLENLSSIHKTIKKIKKKDRYELTSWAFYDLEQKIIYKANQNGSSVIKVDPRYTSQCCPICGHIEKANRNKKMHLFNCKKCGYKSNDDRIGAMNLYRMGINYLQGNQVPSIVATEQALL